MRVAVCQMFELASMLDLEKASEKAFKSTALQGLWRSTFSKVNCMSGMECGFMGA